MHRVLRFDVRHPAAEPLAEQFGPAVGSQVGQESDLFIKNDYGGEGSSGTMGGEVWAFVQRGRWYSMLSRVWQPAGAASMRLWGAG